MTPDQALIRPPKGQLSTCEKPQNKGGWQSKCERADNSNNKLNRFHLNKLQ